MKSPLTVVLCAIDIRVKWKKKLEKNRKLGELPVKNSELPVKKKQEAWRISFALARF